MTVARNQPEGSQGSKDKGAVTNTSRIYNSDAVSLMSMRLMAAPNPEDDLSDEEIYEICKRSPYSREIIKQLIEYIKTL